MRPLTILLIVYLSSLANGKKAISSDVKFPFEMMHNEFSNIEHEANVLFLESGLLNGNIETIELSRQVLKRGYNESVLKEYNDKDINEVIEEQEKLLKLLDEVRESEVTDELKNDIEKGVNELDGLENEVKPKIDKVLEQDYEDIKKMEADSQFSRQFPAELSHSISNCRPWFKTIISDINSSNRRSDDQRNRDNMIITVERFSREFSKLCGKLQKEELLSKAYDLESLNILKNGMEVVEKNIDGMNKLKDLTQNIDMMKSYMEKLGELKSSLIPQQMAEYIEKLEIDIGVVVVDSQTSDLVGIYKKSNNSSSVILNSIDEKMSETDSQRSYIKRKARILSDKWKQFQNFHTEFNSLPSGTLTTSFSKLSACLEQIDTSIDFTKEKIELDASINSLEAYAESWKKNMDSVDRMNEFNKYLVKLEKDLKKNADASFEQYSKFLIAYDFNYAESIEMELAENVSGNLVSNFEIAVMKTHELWQEIDFPLLLELISRTNEKFKETRKFLSCWSDMKTSDSEVQTKMQQLMNTRKEAWNMDLKFLESTVEVIGLIKDAYRMNKKLKEFKFDENGDENEEKKKKFPLRIKELNEISDGLKVINEILKIQENLNEIEEYDEIKGAWDTVDLQNFMRELPENLEDLTKIPSNIQFDSIIKYIQNEYELNGKFEILKIIEEIQNFSSTFDSFKGKLNEMNIGINQFNQWNIMMIDEKKKDLVTVFDCYENPSVCNITITLPMNTQNDPVKEFNVEIGKN